ncbi:MAG: succinylglutamate desuccinylase/aspartoacylase family protein [Phycisphaeraceae bacterium]
MRMTHAAGRMFTILLLIVSSVSGAQQPAGVILKDTKWATPWYVITGDKPGPTVMIIGGAHGNEPAGAYAAEEIRTWRIAKGKLIILPRANVPGLDANTRFLPDAPAEVRDLNRNYPRKADDQPHGELANAIWALVKDAKPDWLIDLHEGYDFHQLNNDSVGSSIIHFNTPDVTPLVDGMLARVNKAIEDPKRQLIALRASGPVDGSLARAATKQLKIPAMILETTSKDQRLPVRARQHRIMVHHLLSHLDMAKDGPHQLAPAASKQALRVALFDDGGVGGSGIPKLEAILSKAGAVVRRIDGEDVRQGVIAQFDVAIFSGGSGSAQAKSLGEDGRKQVSDYVNGGGGYVGICAGAYLATTGYEWSLKIVDARTLHKGKEWLRGRGEVQMKITVEGRAILGDVTGVLPVIYANGPIVGPAMLDAIPDFKPLATFETELAENGTPKGLMVHTPAILAGEFGKGRAVAISPHPEQSADLEAMTLRLIEWAAGRAKPIR